MVGPADTLGFGDALAALFASGRAADLVLACLVIEGAILLALAVRRGSREPGEVARILANLASGAGLVLALRAALLQQPWPAIATCLLLAFAAHAVEIALRRRGPDREPLRSKA